MSEEEIELDFETIFVSAENIFCYDEQQLDRAVHGKDGGVILAISNCSKVDGDDIRCFMRAWGFVLDEIEFDSKGCTISFL